MAGEKFRSLVALAMGYTLGTGPARGIGQNVLDPSEYDLTGATTEVSVYAVVGHAATGATGFVSVHNLTDDTAVATLPFSGTFSKQLESGVSVPPSEKLYEARLSAGGATGPVSVSWVGFTVDRTID